MGGPGIPRVPLSPSAPGGREIIPSLNFLRIIPGRCAEPALPPMPADARGGNLSLTIPMAPEPGAASPDALLLSSTFVGRGEQGRSAKEWC